ncbi:MAG: M23 family metallopeptidase [Actinobacteria bacterium]|nr:M23 family metallopeptidase [Actinomycetota bacterium]
MRKTVLALVLLSVAVATATPARASGDWVWPVVGPIIRGYDPPDSPYGSGHLGIDIATPFGTPVRSVAAGTVTFAGKVGGHLFVTVNHGGGLASTYSWVSELLVRKGDVVTVGQAIALSGTGHPDVFPSHLHLGAKLNGEYVDPLDYLSEGSVVDLIRLAPLVT